MTGAFWPEKHQELLLLAAFSEKSRALDSWRQWREQIDINAIDTGSHRLLPQVYFNLKECQIADPQMNKMKGVYRYSWAKNQHLFHHVQPILLALHQARIPLLVLKGAALALSYYSDFGLRPMQDFDLLIPQQKALVALEIFRKNGWVPKHLKHQPVKRFTPLFLRVYSSMTLENQVECDLHWKVLCCNGKKEEGIEQDLWEKAVPFEWGGVPLLLPSPTDLLFHVCVHGAEYNLIPSFRWVGDAMMLFKRNPSIDWPRLITLAKKHSLSLPLKETLRYLSDLFAAPIPPETLRALDAIQVSNEAATDYRERARTKPPQPLHKIWIGDMQNLLHWHQRISQKSPLSALFTFPKFLRHLWGLKPFELAWQLLRLQRLFWKKHRSSQ